MAVEHQRQSAARAFEDADGVGPAGIDFLADGFQAVMLEPVEHVLGDGRLLRGLLRGRRLGGLGLPGR